MSDSLPRSADLVVIGGGCVGAAVAYFLARSGMTNSVLLEKGALAFGPTGRSGGNLIPRSEHPVIARLKWEGLQFFRNFKALEGPDPEFHGVGYLAIGGPEHRQALLEDLRLLNSLGSGACRLSVADIEAVCPGLALNEEEQALYVQEAGYADSAAATRAVAARARQLGAQVFEFTNVQTIEVADSSVAAVQTDRGKIRTGCVVLASGIWSNFLLEPLGIRLPLFLHRVEVGLFKRPPGMGEHPVIADFSRRAYFRPETGNLTFVGSIPDIQPGTSAPPNLEEVQHPDHFGDGIRASTIQKLSLQLRFRLPAFASGGYWRRGHACVYDVTPDWHPVLSFEQEIQGLFAVAGCSGHGFVMSPALGRITAEALLGREKNAQERKLFRPERFCEQDPVRFQIA